MNAAELGTYDQAKSMLIPYVGEGFVAFLGASTIAAVASATVSTPADGEPLRRRGQSCPDQWRAGMGGG